MAKHSRKVPVLTQVAEGVLVHQSQLLQNNTVVVQGRAGVLLIDPGVTGDEWPASRTTFASWASP
jgi:glyoxylase-like metal-dependent hydrolase (beta-lactamase superfamily II)